MGSNYSYKVQRGDHPPTLLGTCETMSGVVCPDLESLVHRRCYQNGQGWSTGHKRKGRESWVCSCWRSEDEGNALLMSSGTWQEKAEKMTADSPWMSTEKGQEAMKTKLNIGNSRWVSEKFSLSWEMKNIWKGWVLVLCRWRCSKFI